MAIAARVYGGAPNEKTHASVNLVVDAIRPRPEFIAFLGDAVRGYADTNTLRQQWDYWSHTEMRWLQAAGIPLYQATSNHNTNDQVSEEIFREVHPELPDNGPADQKRLAYFVRRGDLLYVSMHQPDRTRPFRRSMRCEIQWLDDVLRSNADARYKFVAGHYPVFPANGYTEYPQWCFRPDERQPFWDVLLRHKVNAYLGSHILAFDVQAHDGLLQIISGGGGTQSSGSRPLTMMPARTEYLHLVQVAVDERELRYRVLGVDGKMRESLVWPFVLPPVESWATLDPENVTATMKVVGSYEIVGWRFRGRAGRSIAGGSPQALLNGWEAMEGCATIWVGIEGSGLDTKLVVRLVPESGHGWQTWTGPRLLDGTDFDFQVALHRGMGPGGILWRKDERSPWSSLFISSSKGAEDITWPSQWAIGWAQSGPSADAFQGVALHISWVTKKLSE